MHIGGTKGVRRKLAAALEFAAAAARARIVKVQWHTGGSAQWVEKRDEVDRSSQVDIFQSAGQ